MEWVKVEQTAGDGFVKVLYSVSKGSLLSAPAKEMLAKDTDEATLKGRPWTEYTLIRVEKGQNAVLLEGDRILASCGRPGDYRIEAEEDISKAKVYFVRTEMISSKVHESNTGIVYPAREPELKVEQDIRLRTALYFNYRIKNPKTFLRYMAEEKSKRISHQGIDAQLYSVFSLCMPDVLAQLSAEGVAYNQLTMCRERLTELMAEKLELAWPNSRGIELKTFAFVKAEPYKVDEKAFVEKCSQAQAADDVTSEAFSAEFEKLMKGLGQAAGDALNAFQEELSSIFGALADAGDSEEDDEKFDDLLNSILNDNGVDVLGSWECPELKQIVTFALLDAAIVTDGREVWRGDWQETQDEDGNVLLVCPTADSLGCYAYFEYHTDAENADEEYLAGVLADTGTEKQYIRFAKMKK